MPLGDFCLFTGQQSGAPYGGEVHPLYGAWPKRDILLFYCCFFFIPFAGMPARWRARDAKFLALRLDIESCLPHGS